MKKEEIETPAKLSDYILEVNNQYIVSNKPAGMSSQEDKSEGKSISQLMEIYAKQQLHIVNRLDRTVSGVVLLTKKASATTNLVTQFQNKKAFKIYLALVEKTPPKKNDTITHYLTKNAKIRKAFVAKASEKNAKKAELKYELLHSFENYHLLSIQIYNGRFHQIRAQLAAIGCPIKGDVKYGARRKNKDRTIHLHAYQIRFEHPVDRQMKEYTAPIPTSDGLWNDVKKIMNK